jgi:hypothetical protein
MSRPHAGPGCQPRCHRGSRMSFPRSAAGGIRLIVEDDRLEDMAISSKADIPIHEQMAEPSTPSNGFIRHLDQSGGVEKAARVRGPQQPSTKAGNGCSPEFKKPRRQRGGFAQPSKASGRGRREFRRKKNSRLFCWAKYRHRSLPLRALRWHSGVAINAPL